MIYMLVVTVTVQNVFLYLIYDKSNKYLRNIGQKLIKTREKKNKNISGTGHSIIWKMVV